MVYAAVFSGATCQTKSTKSRVSRKEMPTDLEAETLRRTIRKKASSNGMAARMAWVVVYMGKNPPSWMEWAKLVLRVWIIAKKLRKCKNFIGSTNYNGAKVTIGRTD